MQSPKCFRCDWGGKKKERSRNWRRQFCKGKKKEETRGRGGMGFTGKSVANGGLYSFHLLSSSCWIYALSWCQSHEASLLPPIIGTHFQASSAKSHDQRRHRSIKASFVPSHKGRTKEEYSFIWIDSGKVKVCIHSCQFLQGPLTHTLGGFHQFSPLLK